MCTSTNQLESSSAGNNLMVLVDKLTTSQQGAFVSWANSMLVCIRKNVARGLREAILSFCSALVRPHLHSWVQIWTPECKKDELTGASPAKDYKHSQAWST